MSLGVAWRLRRSQVPLRPVWLPYSAAVEHPPARPATARNQPEVMVAPKVTSRTASTSWPAALIHRRLCWHPHSRCRLWGQRGPQPSTGGRQPYDLVVADAEPINSSALTPVMPRRASPPPPLFGWTPNQQFALQAGSGRSALWVFRHQRRRNVGRTIFGSSACTTL